MRKLFIDKIDNSKIIISGEEHKHIAYSLRMKKGDEITVCSQGIDYTAVIVSISKTETVAEVVGKARSVSEPDSDVTLFFGALKGDKNDYIVQKCTELGVRNFVPFFSEFSSVSRDNIRTDRLNRIALEASKQCGRGFVPPVQNVVSFNDLFDLLASFDTVVFPYEQEENATFDEISKKSSLGKIAVVIGSEGGFSKSEAEKLREAAGLSITLGERILRADTACVAVVSVLMYSLGEWRRKK